MLSGWRSRCTQLLIQHLTKSWMPLVTYVIGFVIKSCFYVANNFLLFDLSQYLCSRYHDNQKIGGKWNIIQWYTEHIFLKGYISIKSQTTKRPCDSPMTIRQHFSRALTPLAHITSWVERERNVLFNDALNTFYLRLYGVRHMVKDHSDSEKGNPLPPHRLLLSINSKGSFICTIPQTG